MKLFQFLLAVIVLVVAVVFFFFVFLLFFFIFYCCCFSFFPRLLSRLIFLFRRHFNFPLNPVSFNFSIYSGAARKRRSSRHAVCNVDGLFVSSRWDTGGPHQVRITPAPCFKTVPDVLATWKKCGARRLEASACSYSLTHDFSSLDYVRLVSV